MDIVDDAIENKKDDEIEKQKESESEIRKLRNLLEKLRSWDPTNRQKFLLTLIGVSLTAISIILTHVIQPPPPPYENNSQEVVKELTEISKHMESYIENGTLDIAELELHKAKILYNNLSNDDKQQLNSKYNEIYNKLGTAFLNLAKCKDKETNTEKSIAALNEAYIFSDSQITETLGNLGFAYIELSKIKNKKSNLMLAIKYLNESILKEPNKEGLKFAELLEYRGTAYGILSNVKLKGTNLALSLKDYENSLKIVNNLNLNTFDNDILFRIGILKGRIGETYRLMAQIGDQKENLERSITNNSEAENIFNNSNSDHYSLAFLKSNIGSLHLSLSRVDNPLSPIDEPRYHIKKAINNFNDILPVLEPCDFQYIETRSKLAMSQIWLSQTEPNWKSKDLVDNSIKILDSSLAFYLKNNCSINIAKTLSDQGFALYCRSIATGNETDLNEALNKFQIALKTLNLFDYPLDYAETKYNQGMAYERLAYLNNNKKKNLENARDCYEEAISAWKDNECILDSAYAENKLGNIYYDLSKVNRRNSEQYFANLDKAKLKYENALKTFDEDNYPEMEKIVEGNKKIVENS